MISEVSNRFSGVLEGIASATNAAISTTFVVPAGTYFKGNLVFTNLAGSGNASVFVTRGGSTFAALGPNASLTAGAMNTANVPVILNEGTYAVQSQQFPTNSVSVSWTGILFRK